MARKIKSFDDVIGHKNLIKFLQRHVKEDNIANVVIFYGNSGIGKSTIAKLLAIAVATRYESEELKQQYIQSVIVEDKPTDSIKLFNMAEIQEKEDKIQEVKSELSLGFSKTKRKVLVLDEGHRMSKIAQDSILTSFENLEEGIYVFICTTDISALQTTMRSRGKAPYRLYDLTDAEAKAVIRREIEHRHLQFDMNVNVVISLICDWAKNQPRMMCNLLENFADGSLVTSRDLEVFINVNTAPAVIELLKYLYGSMTLGIEYIGSLQCDDGFVTMLIEVCKVALGHTSNSISTKDTMYIKDFMNGKNEKHIIQFTAMVTGLQDVRKNRVISAFMHSHVSYVKESLPVKSSGYMEDINTLSQNKESNSVFNLAQAGIEKPKSLEEMFGNAEVVDFENPVSVGEVASDEIAQDMISQMLLQQNNAHEFGGESLCNECGEELLSTGKCSNIYCTSNKE